MNFIDKIFLKVLGYFDDLAEKINDVVTFDVINFGHGPDVMNEVGISESAIKLEHDKVAMAKLNAMLGEMRALPIDEYIVIYNPQHKDILVTKAS